MYVSVPICLSSSRVEDRGLSEPMMVAGRGVRGWGSMMSFVLVSDAGTFYGVRDSTLSVYTSLE